MKRNPVLKRKPDDVCRRIFCEIEKLREHIRREYLSGIWPGSGTESNEQLHRFLNSSLLCGATSIGPELTIVVLSVLFYSYNFKRKARKHSCNTPIFPCRPIDSSITDFALAD